MAAKVLNIVLTSKPFGDYFHKVCCKSSLFFSRIVFIYGQNCVKLPKSICYLNFSVYLCS
jgi:hypothetical protein